MYADYYLHLTHNIIIEYSVIYSAPYLMCFLCALMIQRLCIWICVTRENLEGCLYILYKAFVELKYAWAEHNFLYFCWHYLIRWCRLHLNDNILLYVHSHLVNDKFIRIFHLNSSMKLRCLLLKKKKKMCSEIIK